ncbi:MAG TPA: hypothetical protein VII56_12775 [Rhizomicrobium sp.]
METLRLYPFGVARTVHHDHSTFVMPARDLFKGGVSASVDLSNDENIGKIFREEVFHPEDGAYTIIFRAIPAKDSQGNLMKDRFGRDILLHEGFAIRKPFANTSVRVEHLDAVHRFVEPYFHRHLDIDRDDSQADKSAFRYTEDQAIEYHHQPEALDVIGHEAIQVGRYNNPTAFTDNPVVDWKEAIKRPNAGTTPESAQKKTSLLKIEFEKLTGEGSWRTHLRSLVECRTPLVLLIGGSVLIGAVVVINEINKRKGKETGRPIQHPAGLIPANDLLPSEEVRSR